MKKLCFILILILMAPAYIEAQKVAAPDGFLGLKWGSSTLKFRELSPPAQHLNDPDDKGKQWGQKWHGKIGEVDVGSTGYIFNKDRFFVAITHFKEKKNYRILKDALILKYGQPQEMSPLVLKVNPNSKVGEECIWKIETVWITLKINELKDEGTLQYSYLPILEEGIKEEKRDAQKTKDSL